MDNHERINLNLLGRKRSKNKIILKDESKKDQLEKTNENNPKKKSKIFYILKVEKNSKIHNNMCQKCNSRDDLLSFNSNKSILDYLSNNNIIIFKNITLDKNVNFDSPKIICVNCLLMISKNQNEFEKFIATNTYTQNGGNVNPINNFYNNLNLKNFNCFETEKNQIQNKLTEDISEKTFDAKILNELNNINNNINNSDINFDFLNTLNYPYLPLINYNMPFNQNISNLNIHNYFNNNLNNSFNKNSNLKESDMKDNNMVKNNSLRIPIIVNDSDMPQNPLLNNNFRIFPSNDINILNEQDLNQNYLNEKNNQNENKQNIMINNTSDYTDKEKISKDDNEILEQDYILKNFTKIKNEDFDEIFQIVSNLYNKLLDIKISRDIYLDIKKLFNNDSRILSSNNSIFFNSNLNLDLNYFSNINNSNKDNINYNNINNSNNAL